MAVVGRGPICCSKDGHSINQICIDRFLAPEPVAEEVVTGPIATTTLQTSILASAGPAGLLGFNALLDLVGVHCRHLAAYSYGVVDVEASAGTATITLKDEQGNVLTDQQDPAVLCTKTLGP
jgi:hypothetical protein